MNKKNVLVLHDNSYKTQIIFVVVSTHAVMSRILRRRPYSHWIVQVAWTIAIWLISLLKEWRLLLSTVKGWRQLPYEHHLHFCLLYSSSWCPFLRLDYVLPIALTSQCNSTAFILALQQRLLEPCRVAYCRRWRIRPYLGTACIVYLLWMCLRRPVALWTLVFHNT